MRIQISEIKVKPGRRETVPSHVEELSRSISEVGLLNPITVEQDFTLIAGLHRLEAAKLLGWEEIECSVTSLEGLQAELAEIDENIIRCDFSSMESNDLLLRRKELYESLHPETKNGGNRRSKDFRTKNIRSDSTRSFTQDTAEKLGVSRRTVEKKIQLARDLTPEAKQIVTQHHIGSECALKISKLPPEQQAHAAAMLAAGEIKSVEDYPGVSHDSPVDLPRQPAQEQAGPPPSDTTTAVSPTNSTGAVEPDKVPASPEAPFTLGGKRFASFQESVADLKDLNKDCSCTPDSFLAEITEFVKKFHNEIGWFHISYYEVIFPKLTQIQQEYFQTQLNAIHTAVDQLRDHVKKGQVENG